MDDGHAQRVDVGGGDGISHELFRRGIAIGAGDRTRMAALAQGCDRAHIDDPYIDVMIVHNFDEDIARLDVAVNDGGRLMMEFPENGQRFSFFFYNLLFRRTEALFYMVFQGFGGDVRFDEERIRRGIDEIDVFGNPVYGKGSERIHFAFEEFNGFPVGGIL